MSDDEELSEEITVRLPATFKFYFANSNARRSILGNMQSPKKKENAQPHIANAPLTMDEICDLLSFDLLDMNPETQKKLNVVEYAQFIYFHFVHRMAKHKIQFSDKSNVKYIEQSLFEDCNVSERQ